MKKIFIYSLMSLFMFQTVFAADTFFDSMDDAQEVKLAPSIKSTASQAQAQQTQSIKEEKFNNALTNLDDAQVELRQDLAEVTAQYNEALNEKERVIANCKSLKKEINLINKKMKNIDKSKQMINKSIQNPQ